MRRFDFETQLEFSQGYMNGGIARILEDRIPGCTSVRKAKLQDDRNGTDYWADRLALPALSVDAKVRDEDWAAKPPPLRADDLALETWSVIDRKPGWTRDPAKRTDYVLWYWRDTGRFFLVPFPPLCKIFQRYWKEWRETYRHAPQDSGGWKSECVFVPRAVVIEKLMAWTSGAVNA